MVERQRRHPDAILVRVRGATGFGFTYLSEGDFHLAAMDPIKVKGKSGELKGFSVTRAVPATPTVATAAE